MEITSVGVEPFPDRATRVIKATVRVELENEWMIQSIRLAVPGRVPVLILPRSSTGSLKPLIEFEDPSFYQTLRKRVVEQYNRRVPASDQLPRSPSSKDPIG